MWQKGAFDEAKLLDALGLKATHQARSLRDALVGRGLVQKNGRSFVFSLAGVQEWLCGLGLVRKTQPAGELVAVDGLDVSFVLEKSRRAPATAQDVPKKPATLTAKVQRLTHNWRIVMARTPDGSMVSVRVKKRGAVKPGQTLEIRRAPNTADIYEVVA